MIKNNPSFCFIIQATGKYYNYAVDFINSATQFMCPSNKRKIIVFTDQRPPSENEYKGIFVSERNPPSVRKDTCLFIFDYILSAKNTICEYDFVYKVDADMLVADFIDSEEIIPNKFMGIQHFNNKTQQNS